MRTIKRLVLILALIATGNLYSQSYTINHFQSTYDTLTDYNSLALELFRAGQTPELFQEEFIFGFDFPFYDKTETSILIRYDGITYFPNSPSYNMYLFASDYMIAIWDTANLYSDFRYAYTTKDSLQALVFEYHNVYHLEELYLNGENHTINFQMWLLENGDIELHFGEIELSNCSYYFPGQGFSLDNTSPTGNIYGPWVSINNYDITKSACFGGDHSNPSIIYDDDFNCDVLTSIPPKGYVVQFKRNGNTSIEEPEKTMQYALQQNGDNILISGDMSHYQFATVYDMMGRILATSNDNSIQLANTASQILIVVIEDEKGVEKHKISFDTY